MIWCNECNEWKQKYINFREGCEKYVHVKQTIINKILKTFIVYNRQKKIFQFKTKIYTTKIN